MLCLQTAVVIFAIYTASQPDHTLSPGVAFVSLTLLNSLRNGLNHIPHSISFAVEVGFGLLNQFKCIIVVVGEFMSTDSAYACVM